MFSRTVPSVAFAIIFTALTARPAHAASPSLGGLTPRGAQRGTEVEVVLSGGQLHDAQEILF